MVNKMEMPLETSHCANFTEIFFPVRLRAFCHVANNTAFFIAITANLLLVALINGEKNRNLRAYSTVLLLNCAFDIFTSIVAFVTQMQMEILDGYVVYIINGLLAEFSLIWHFAFTFFYCVSVCAAVNIIVVIFIFRYWLICRDLMLSRRTLGALTAAPLLYAILESAFIILSLAINGSTRSCWQILDNPIWWEPGTRRPPNKCLFTPTNNTWFIATIFLGIVGVNVIFGVMCMSSFYVLKTLHRKRVKFTQRTRQLQRQLNWMLFIQMSAPLFTCFFPALMLILSPILHMSFPGIGLFVSEAFAWIPCVNPLVAICFVASFRQRFLRSILPTRANYYFGGMASITSSSN